MKKIKFPAVICCIIFLCSCFNKPATEKTASLTAAKNTTIDCCKANPKGKLLVCSLTSPELQNRKATVLSELRKKVLVKKEEANGYSFKFSGSDSTINQLTDFIKSERQCCAFLTFNLQIEDAQSNVWVTISGPEGTKNFITGEMDL